MMQQDRAVQEHEGNGNLPVIPQRTGAGLEEFDMMTQGIIPRVTIVQPMTSNQGGPGRFWHNTYQRNLDGMRVVMLVFGMSRILFASRLQTEEERAGNLDKRILCVSRGKGVGGIKPTSGAEIQSELCAQCVHAQWGGTAGNVPPKCQLNFDVLCTTADKHSPFILSVHGVSLAPVRRWVSMLKGSGKNAYSASVQLTVEEDSGPMGKFYRLKVEDTIWLDELDPARLELITAEINNQAQAEGHDENWIQGQIAEQEQKAINAQLYPYYVQWQRFGGVELSVDPAAEEAANDATEEVPF